MLSIATTLALLITRLRAAIGTHLGREARVQPPVWIGTTLYAPRIDPKAPSKLPEPIWSLLWRRLGRLSERFTALHTKWQQNRLPTPRVRPNRPRTSPNTPRPRLPGQFGWVNRRIPECAPPAGMLEALVRDPATRNFVEAAPQAARLLRPLCHAAGVRQPDWLALPRRPRKPRPKRPAPPRPPTDRPLLLAALLPGDPPLQPYVLAAAKAARKFGM
jgi:hypothetical protein